MISTCFSGTSIDEVVEHLDRCLDQSGSFEVS